MNLPLRPISSRRFQSAEPLGLVTWLQAQGFVLALDTPEQVRLELGQETVTIAADGSVTIGGEMVERAYQRLLLVSEE